MQVNYFSLTAEQKNCTCRTRLVLTTRPVSTKPNRVVVQTNRPKRKILSAPEYKKKKKKNYVGVGTKDVCSRLMRNSLQFSRPSWAHLGDVIHSISSAQIAFWLCNYCFCHGQNSIGNPPTIYSLLWLCALGQYLIFARPTMWQVITSTLHISFDSKSLICRMN